MLAVAGLVGISFIWSVTSFTAGPLLPRTRSVGDLRNQHQQRHSLNQHQQRHSLAERRQQPSSAEPAVAAIWPQEQHQRQPRLLHRITTRLAAAPAGESEAEATTTAPRLKRVRKRRKDPASIPTAGDEDEGIEGDGVGAVAAAVSPIAEEVPAVAQAAAAATTSAAEEIRSQVAQTFQEESPRSAGGTKGTRVRTHIMQRHGCRTFIVNIYADIREASSASHVGSLETLFNKLRPALLTARSGDFQPHERSVDTLLCEKQMSIHRLSELRDVCTPFNNAVPDNRHGLTADSIARHEGASVGGQG